MAVDNPPLLGYNTIMENQFRKTYRFHGEQIVGSCHGEIVFAITDVTLPDGRVVPVQYDSENGIVYFIQEERNENDAAKG